MKGPEVTTGWLHADALSYRAVTISTSVERVTKKIRLGGVFFVQPEFEQDVNVDDVESDGSNDDDDPVLFFGRPDDETGIVNDWTS